ncbi:3D-(3,5/4)-trihydroxycyclohexane-1,2-dione acylhydrolase (decyclizing) [Amycolatopsis echigonensis]|uniref:3D-(3,5/4)-trihydroxycyclohexane-1,2-dione acylhydrolase (Decyclizing) n=1 Tax=Amycolatopsis echigonensis TaxID=2576905 RepID=A0A8E1W747_9PSEU|nr:3D-(3,5/4)-trihydroxycyclohexane-1,2-dione acylhydrolase (decyclizing) [Amycolatopsis echigonensis]MBB2504897.1 3D-(3,5/4)-trihydroxycyclohexane-1,2-dione acylhydrolase (decyclizing) [Amycolatopsis echigonensis]
MGTVRVTAAQAVVLYLGNQYSVSDGQRRRLVPGMLGIFGHGNVAGLGQALDEYSDSLTYYQGRNEQSMVHLAVGYAKAMRRTATLAVTASIGPGSTNMVTGAALATINRLPVLLFPSDTYATRRQGVVLQQLETPGAPEVTVNDAFRPVSRFFDRITRPEQLLTALPAAMRVLTNPAETGAVVISLPQDVQSMAFDFPEEFFAEKDWPIRRRTPNPDEVADVARLLAEARRPLVIAGGGVIYSGATAELEALAGEFGLPVVETFGGKGAVQAREWWQLGGLGLEGNPASNTLAAEADLVLHVGTRLTDFATGSQSLFANPHVRFASINVTEQDAVKQGATAIVADAKLAVRALADHARDAGAVARPEWAERARALAADWAPQRQQALSGSPRDPMTQGQLIGVLQEEARSGDTVVAAAGGPPGDLLKVWDATDGRHCHLEFGFSCMGYELPASIGVRLAHPDGEVLAFIGDGTFLMQPTELATAVQEGLKITVVISENHGFQVIRRLQMLASGNDFGNEFRRRAGEPGALAGGYVDLDLAAIARGLGATAFTAATPDEVRAALRKARDHAGPVVVVAETAPQENLPPGGVWWDVAPAEVSQDPAVQEKRRAYESAREAQRWYA